MTSLATEYLKLRCDFNFYGTMIVFCIFCKYEFVIIILIKYIKVRSDLVACVKWYLIRLHALLILGLFRVRCIYLHKNELYESITIKLNSVQLNWIYWLKIQCHHLNFSCKSRTGKGITITLSYSLYNHFILLIVHRYSRLNWKFRLNRTFLG